MKMLILMRYILDYSVCILIIFYSQARNVLIKHPGGSLKIILCNSNAMYVHKSWLLVFFIIHNVGIDVCLMIVIPRVKVLRVNGTKIGFGGGINVLFE